jgi:hypothetical protein
LPTGHQPDFAVPIAHFAAVSLFCFIARSRQSEMRLSIQFLLI